MDNKEGNYSKQITELDKQITGLETQRAELHPVIERHEATRLQTAMRGKKARNTLQKQREMRQQKQ